MDTTSQLIRCAIDSANKMYGHLEDLHDILEELVNDYNLTYDEKKALFECKQALNAVELLDELVARLGCIYLD